MKSYSILLIALVLSATANCQGGNKNKDAIQEFDYSISRLPDSLKTILFNKLRRTEWDSSGIFFDSIWKMENTRELFASGKLVFGANQNLMQGYFEIPVENSDIKTAQKIKYLRINFSSYSLTCVCKNHNKHECDCDDKKCKEKNQKENSCLGWVYDSKSD
jgi:hypothetical protein